MVSVMNQKRQRATQHRLRTKATVSYLVLVSRSLAERLVLNNQRDLLFFHPSQLHRRGQNNKREEKTNFLYTEDLLPELAPYFPNEDFDTLKLKDCDIFLSDFSKTAVMAVTTRTKQEMNGAYVGANVYI